MARGRSGAGIGSLPRSILAETPSPGGPAEPQRGLRLSMPTPVFLPKRRNRSNLRHNRKKRGNYWLPCRSEKIQCRCCSRTCLSSCLERVLHRSTGTFAPSLNADMLRSVPRGCANTCRKIAATRRDSEFRDIGAGASSTPMVWMLGMANNPCGHAPRSAPRNPASLARCR
jgi:hypothetical protein